MKFLDLSPLARQALVPRSIDALGPSTDLADLRSGPPLRINTFLDHVDVGEYVVYGDLEAYSCETQRAVPSLRCPHAAGLVLASQLSRGVNA